MTVDFLEREDYKTRLIDGSRIIHGYMGGPFCGWRRVFFNPDRFRLVLLANDDFERIKN